MRTPARPPRTTRPAATTPTTITTPTPADGARGATGASGAARARGATGASGAARANGASAAAAAPRRPPAAAVHAELRGGRTVLRELRAAPPWAPRPLAPDGATARVALVQTAATLLGGDRCALHVALGPGARLELVETGATVAHHARGGEPARLTVTVELAPGARLTWPARPLVLAAGSAVVRETTVALAAGAVALLRETVVLGRSGERPGALAATLRATHAGRPLLHERLDTAAPLRSPIVAGAAATLDTVVLLGARGADLPGSSQLAGPGTLWRALHGRDTDPDPAARTVVESWRNE